MKSIEIRKLAIELFKQDKSLLEVASRCEITERTSKTWYNDWRNGTFRFEKKKVQPKVKYTDAHIEYMKKMIEEDPFITIQGLVQKIRGNRRLKNLSAGTVAKIRAPLGKKAKIRYQPKIEEEHEAARLEFCRNNKDNDFKNWIFTDETIFELKPTGQYFKLKGSKRKVAPIPKQKIKVMFWGAISFDHKYKLVVIEGKMNAIGYRKMLHRYFLKDYYKIEHKDVFFQQDNASPHVAKSSLRFLKMVGLNVVDHPALSPDLNPIEIIWSWMKKEFNRYECQSREDIESSVVKIWKSLPQRIIRNVIEGLQKRVKHIVDIEGAFSSGELLSRKKLSSIPTKPDFERINGINISDELQSIRGTQANTTSGRLIID